MISRTLEQRCQWSADDGRRVPIECQKRRREREKRERMKEKRNNKKKNGIRTKKE